jgi:L-amino acid N-acyltransferase YncA
MSSEKRSYPRTVLCDGIELEIGYMSAAQQASLLAFARALPSHDLLFLRRDITQPKVLAAWIEAIAQGSIISLVALRGSQVVGCTALIRDEFSWSPHVGELRIAVAADMRGKGLGRLLAQESFMLALELGLEKLVAYMTVDQRGAIAIFESLGFRGEAMLRDHVKDREGRKHDLAILSHDVARVQAQMHAYGLGEDRAGAEQA